MSRLTQEEMDAIFMNWINEEKHRIRLLECEDFTKTEAIEMLKAYHLDCISDAVYQLD